jgi:hypothetical protein
MKSTPQNLTFLAIAFLGLIFSAYAQKNYELNKNQKFSLSGTSTLHDWEMASREGAGTANFTIKDSKVEQINALTVTILSESIKSGKGAMDKNAYKTLNTDEFKTITYVLKKAKKVNDITWNLTGSYTIAGVCKELKTQVKTSVQDGIVNLEGSNIITFKEFGMSAPKVLLGTIKTGQELMIKFNINFN